MKRRVFLLNIVIWCAMVALERSAGVMVGKKKTPTATRTPTRMPTRTATRTATPTATGGPRWVYGVTPHQAWAHRG